ncbi:hypothetical protein STENM36S_03826 [Streptomyces tendae]
MARLAGRRALSAVHPHPRRQLSFGVFAITTTSPFDPVKAYAGTAALGADQETLDRLRENLGVDESFVVRWWHWLTSALTGDLGHSSVLSAAGDPGDRWRTIRRAVVAPSPSPWR